MNIEVKTSNRPIPYKTAINTLEKRVIDVRNGKKRVNLGVRTSNYLYRGCDIRKKKYLIKNLIIKTNRGGKLTLHNRGQK